MLTDYHLHLRPDEDGTPPSRYFTEENVDRYRGAASERGIEELGVDPDEHLTLVISAMAERADELGIAPEEATAEGESAA